MLKLASPAATASSGPEVLADWLELGALIADDGNSALQELVQTLRQGGTAEEEDDEEASRPRTRRKGDIAAERAQAVAAAAFDELDNRYAACAVHARYPFLIRSDYIECRANARKSLYVFLLLLSYYGQQDKAAIKLFEELCAEIAASYLGGRASGVESYAFGFPRRYLPPAFPAAVDELASKLGEGDGIRPSARAADQKDGRLDVVAWRPFADGRIGKLIAFGQCAAGKSALSLKLSELQPSAFQKLWLKGSLAVDPVRMFFLPWRTSADSWESDTIYGGIMFDRCRIVEFSDTLPAAMRRAYGAWSAKVLKTELGA